MVMAVFLAGMAIITIGIDNNSNSTMNQCKDKTKNNENDRRHIMRSPKLDM